MPDSRIKKPWLRNPLTRARQFRRERRFALEPLENRTSLSAGLDISTNLAPAEFGSASASLTAPSALEAAAEPHARARTDNGNADHALIAAAGDPDGRESTDTGDTDHALIGAASEPDAREQSDTGDADQSAIEPGGEPDARESTDTGGTGHALIGAAGEPDAREQSDAGDAEQSAIEPGGEPDAREPTDSGDAGKSAIEPGGESFAFGKTDSGDAGAAGQVSSSGAGGTTPLPTAPANDGNPPTSDPNSNPSQDGSDGGANPPPDVPDAPVAPPPAAQQDDFNPGLLDPLAWTVSDDQPFTDVSDSFDAQDPVLPSTGPGAAGPSTLMDQPDDVAIGGSPDSRSAVGLGADSFAFPAFAPDLAQAARDPFAVDPLTDSLAPGATAWRRLSNGRDRYDKTSSSLDEHIAELSPLDRSTSLALAATLWGTPPQSQPGPNPGNIRSVTTKRHLDVEPATSSWKVFVMGLDQAFERSYRDVRRGLTAETESTVETERSRREAADRLEWRGTILPAARPLESDSSPGASATAAAAPSAGGADSFVPAVIQLGEFLFENLVNPVLGNEHGGDRDSQ
jgi:hypothetical protein